MLWENPPNLRKISFLYPFSPNIPQNFKKSQKPLKILNFFGKSPKIERKFGKFHHDIHLVIIKFKS